MQDLGWKNYKKRKNQHKSLGEDGLGELQREGSHGTECGDMGRMPSEDEDSRAREEESPRGPGSDLKPEACFPVHRQSLLHLLPCSC